MRGDKEKFNFYLSGDIMREFKDMCYLKHGCGYGVIGFELEIAINRSLSDFKNGGSTHSTHTQNSAKALELKNKIINWLISSKQFEDLHGVRLPKPILAQGITAVEGCTDDRTIKNRIHLLVSKNCIKESEDSDKLNKRYIFILDGEYLKKEEM